MPQYVTPGLYFEIVDTAQKEIDPTRVDIPAFLGYAAQGPVHQPTQINSQAQFQAIFGGFTSNSYLAYTVRAFFENGGTRCYVVRVASISVKAASIELQDKAGEPTLRIRASSPGSWSNDLTISLTRTSTCATQATKTVVVVDPSSGKEKEQSFVDSIVGFSRGTLVRAFQQHESTPDSTVGYTVVAESSPGSKILTWETPLDKGFELDNPKKPISLETVEFSLSVCLAGQLRETFTRLSLVPKSDYYVTKAISEKTSQLIRVEDLQSPTPLPDRLPIEGSVRMQTEPGDQAGADGLADVQPEDFIGDPTSEEKRGLRALEDVPDVATIAIPDLTLQPVPVPQKVPPSIPSPDPCLPGTKPLSGPGRSLTQLVEQPPAFSLDQVSRVQQAMIDFCEEQKRCFALLDPPVQSSGNVLSVAEIQGWSQRFNSKYAALYYPWLLVYDPLKLNGQIVRAIPPCGHVAGMFARADHDIGPHRAPANEELNWVQGISVDITSAVQGILNPLSINCIRTFPGRGIRIYGARTLSHDPSWRYVNVRRLFLMLERSIAVATQWTVFEPNDFKLRQTLVLAITTFLEGLWKKGAFAGSRPTDAFFVKINDKLATDEGQLIVEVGVAPSIPAEFVVFRIGHTFDVLESTTSFDV